MQGIYNPLKLPEYLAKFRPIRAAIIGAGAVGSYVAEYLAKMGVGSITLMDFDTFTLENAAKHSGIVRTPEDVGRNKAVTVARRTQTLMVDGGRANGIDANVCLFGPGAFAGFDVVFLALDNYAAKVYFNQIWLQIPQDKRPVVIMGGTNEEMAQSNCIDGKEMCLRCLFDESWLQTPGVRTSCSGPQYRDMDGESAIVRTSGLASSMAAHLMVEQLRAHVTGCDDAVNTRVCYTAYPVLGISGNAPMKRRTCPDCRDYHPPEQVITIPGSVETLTLKDAFTAIAKHLGTEDFELQTHTMVYSHVGYSGLIVADHCHSCGKPLENVCTHESRTFIHDLLCPECRSAGKTARHDVTFPPGEVLHALSPNTCEERLLNQTLFRLGWPVGGYLKVVTRGDALDVLDEGFTYTTFICAGDGCLMDDDLRVENDRITRLNTFAQRWGSHESDIGTYKAAAAPKTITEEDSVEALRNDYAELIHHFDPKYVVIQRFKPPAGSMLLLRVTVNAPSFYLNSRVDALPKATNQMYFYINVYNGYPKVKPAVYYPKDRYLASVNTFRDGAQCTDTWHTYSSITTLCEKTCRAIVQDPCVARFDSMANSSMENWQKERIKNGTFPTMMPGRLLYRKPTVALPTTPVHERPTKTPPPLPGG